MTPFLNGVAVGHERRGVVVDGGGTVADDRGGVARRLMGGDGGLEVEVHDHVGAREHHVVGGVADEERLVVDDVAQQEAEALVRAAVDGAGEDEQAAVLAVEHPVAAGAHVVEKRPVVLRNDHADGADAGVDHVGQREVNETVTAGERQASHRTTLREPARHVRLVVRGDKSDSLAFHGHSPLPMTTSSPARAVSLVVSTLPNLTFSSTTARSPRMARTTWAPSLTTAPGSRTESSTMARSPT